jgi:hypothetical protein
MGQTPDEIHEHITSIRARMTETIRAISLTAEIRSRVEERIRSNALRNARSADEAPSNPLTKDSEVDAEMASEGDPKETSGPVSPRAAARRNRALLATMASAAAGILAGLVSMNHPPRGPREPGEEKSRSLPKKS